MKTVAMLGCLDTKEEEFRYAAGEMARYGLNCVMIDVSTRPGSRPYADFSTADVSREAGVDWATVEGGSQHELLDIMARGARSLVMKLFRSGGLNGLFSCGGLQNTTIAASAAQALPIGIPKVILSTVASGQRTFDSIVGAKDIVTIPSISDFAGLNPINQTMLDNAIAAVAGMVLHAGRQIPKRTAPLIGTTLMGATNDGVMNAIAHLKDLGCDVVSFHSTGCGGRCMEDLITSHVITAAMDLTLHEVVYEYFGRGFGYGAKDRLMAAVKTGIPLLVCPAGIDFICQWREELFDDAKERQVHWHNKNLAHVKLKESEITDISRIIIGRLNKAGPKQAIKVVMPTQGFRNHTRKGEALYAPDLDRLIIDLFRTELRDDIPVQLVDHHFIDREFSSIVAEEMVELLRKGIK